MTPALLFGPYGSAAIRYAARFVDYGANACWVFLHIPPERYIPGLCSFWGQFLPGQ